MAKFSSLKNLASLAQKKSDYAAQHLATLNISEQNAEHKLRLLLSYRDDYYERFQKSAAAGVDQTAWRNFHAFMSKLDAAIAEQRTAVAASKNEVRNGQVELQAEQRRVKSFGTLVQRDARAEATRSARREQREQDEHAAKGSASNKSPM